MKKRHQVLLVLSLLSMITFLDRIAISSASGRIIDDLKLTPVQWGWILGIFTLAYAGFEVPTGFLGDRLGAKKVLIRVVLWWSLFTVLTGFSTSFISLLVIRFLFGVGEAGAYPNTSIALSKWFPSVERARAQSIIWAASRIGAALTPFIVIPIQQKYGWQTTFYILGIVGVLWTIGWFFWFKEEPSQSKSISDDELKEIESTRNVETHKVDPSYNYWRNFKSANLWYLLGMYFCYAIGAYFFQSWLHTYLEKGRHLSQDNLKWASSLPFILAAVGCLAGGWLSDKAVLKFGIKWGRRIVPMIGLALSGISIILAALTQDNLIAVIALGIGMACMDVAAPVSWAVAMDIGGNKSGTISGTMNTAGLTGAYLSTIAFGYLATRYGYNFPVLLLGGIVFAGAFMWFLIDASKKLEDN